MLFEYIKKDTTSQNGLVDIDANDIIDVTLPDLPVFDSNYTTACDVEADDGSTYTIVGFSRDDLRRYLGWS